MKKEQLLQDTPPLNTAICFESQTFATTNTLYFSKYWCHIFQIDYELDVIVFFSKYWCHIFQIDYELDVIGFATHDYRGIFS